MVTADPAVLRAPRSRKKSLLRRILLSWQLYVLLLPGVIAFIIFEYIPLYGIQLAFKDFKYNLGIGGSPWIGFQHFQKMFANPDFWRATRNTLIISFGKLISGFPVPIILALLLNELKSQKFKKITQTILYLPHFISWIIIAALVSNLFSTTMGLYGKIYKDMIGGAPPAILGNPTWFRTILYVSSIWKGAGWGTIIYLAALAGVDVTLYEAAKLDGASRFQMAWYITLPSLAFAITINLILSLGGVMNAGFDQILNLYAAPTYVTGDIIDTYVFRLGVSNGKFDVSTAVGLFKNIINCVLLFAADRVAKALGQGGLF